MKHSEQCDGDLREKCSRAVHELRYSSADGVHISDGPKQLTVSREFTCPVDMRLGCTTVEQRVVLIHGRECPQLGASYLLVQPDVVARDPRRGWLPLGGRHPEQLFLGSEDSPELELGDGVDPDHAVVSITSEGICITDGSSTGTDVRAHPDDVMRVQ